jgi:uncharacterized membrane protein
MTHNSDQLYRIALLTLIILQTVMLGSLYAGVAPHPPAKIPLFAIAPFLAVSLSAAAGALVAGPRNGKLGRTLAVLAALGALLSFGPQKYFDAQFHLIWPAVIAGQVASAVVIFCALRSVRGNEQPS